MPIPQHRTLRVICCPAIPAAAKQAIDDNLTGIEWLSDFSESDAETPDLAIISIDHDVNSIRALCNRWLSQGTGTVVRLENGNVQSRIIVVTDQADAVVPSGIRFYLDGDDDTIVSIGSEGSDKRQAFVNDLRGRLARLDGPVSVSVDVAGLETYIRNRLTMEFPPLAYHNPRHIFDVYEACGRIASGEGVTGIDLDLLRIAALFHDAGFIHTYDHHEARGADMAAAVMPVFGFNADQIRTVSALIMATRVPQRPVSLLECILCDADLDYLGRDDFYTTGRYLYDELRSIGVVDGEQAWNLLQQKFLENHRYHTAYSRKHREPAKQERLKEIRKLVD